MLGVEYTSAKTDQECARLFSGVNVVTGQYRFCKDLIVNNSQFLVDIGTDV